MSETRQRTEIVRVRLTPAELAELRAKAGGSVAGFVRAAALGRRLKVRDPQLVAGLTHLGRLGGLLKLALTKLETGTSAAVLRPQIEATLAAVRRTADGIAVALSGE